MPSTSSTGGTLLNVWQRLRPWPGGSLLFSRLLGWMVPYSGTLGARVEVLEPGYARVALRDRRRVRNHLKSVHAIALINLAELTGGLAVATALRPETRGIVVHIAMEYLKKARGRLTAESRASVPAPIDTDIEHHVQAQIFDAGGECVARAEVRWRLGPDPNKS